jgi:hypothetical protein
MENKNATLGIVKEQSEKIEKSAGPLITMLARFGYAAKGVVYIIIGALAAFAAYKGSGQPTDSHGALEQIMSQPYGKYLLVAVAIGLAGYALWRFVQALKDTEDKGSGIKGIAIRIGYAVIGIVYIGLAFSAVQIIRGFGSNGNNDSTSQEWTATLLAQPFGQWLVALGGSIFIIVALSHFYKAYTVKFRKKLMISEMSQKVQTFAIRTGRFGLAARGIVFGIIGAFLILAALHSNAGEARGLGGALNALQQQTYGQILLGLVALGLIAYGFYMLVEARYRKIIL